MKKTKYKLLFLYAFSAMSLCACASSISNDDDISASESTEISEPSSTTEESSVPESATEKFTWPVKETQAEETLPFDLNEETEYLYTKFYDEPVYDFVPSPDYKAVFPYYGLTTINVYTHDDVEIEQGLHYSGYGFCSADGAIITEPYYADVEDDYKGSGAYLVKKIDTRYYKDYEVYESFTRYGIVNITGTIYTGCDYTKIMYENDRFYAFKTYDTGITLTVFSKDLNILEEESPFLLDESRYIRDSEDQMIDYDFAYISDRGYRYSALLEEINIKCILSNDTAIIDNYLCDFKNGKAFTDYIIINTRVDPDYENMLVALCDDGYYCLLDQAGNEISPHFYDMVFNCPLFIAREAEFEEYHLINGLGELLGILPAEAEIIGTGDYFMVKNDNNNYDIYDSNNEMIAENIETNGDYREIFNEDAKTSRCPFVKGKDEGMVIDPLNGNMLYLGSDFYSVYMFGDTYYFKTSKTTVRCDRELNVLDFVDNAIIENFSDLKTGKQYIIADKAKKIKEIRDPDTYALVLTIPSDEFGTVLYDGILGLLYYDDPKTYGVASSRLTRLFPLDDPETIIFKYKENVEYNTRKERAEIVTDE
ncbi:MAG: hypothetical protein IKO30_02850 [Lachnospiraceae bacterium]|nr:hypothetical protein [Lachnospiraceae bacterium]